MSGAEPDPSRLKPLRLPDAQRSLLDFRFHEAAVRGHRDPARSRGFERRKVCRFGERELNLLNHPDGDAETDRRSTEKERSRPLFAPLSCYETRCSAHPAQPTRNHD